MAEFHDNHRGHAIFSHTSGPPAGPWVGMYSAWKKEPNGSSRLVTQGTLPGVFQSIESAHEAANTEARNQLDTQLDAK